jgi:hypothetical protein
LARLLEMARQGITELFDIQKKAVGI